MIKRKAFGSLELSPLGFGSAPVGILAEDQAKVTELVAALLESGVNLFDTASSYAGAEEMLGVALGDRRKEVFLVSKCGRAVPGLPGEEWSARLITASIDQTLRRLKTDYVDAMLLHSCDRETLERGEALDVLVKAKEEGKVRHVGYSGDNDPAAYAARLSEISIIETSINLCDQANIWKVLPIARTRELCVLAKRPLANAAWKQPEEQPGFYKEYSSEYHQRFAQMGLSIHDFGWDQETTWAEIALRFVLSVPGVHAAVAGTTKLANAMANIRAVEKGPLSEREMEKIQMAFQVAEARGGDRWLGLT